MKTNTQVSKSQFKSAVSSIRYLKGLPKQEAVKAIELLLDLYELHILIPAIVSSGPAKPAQVIEIEDFEPPFDSNFHLEIFLELKEVAHLLPSNDGTWRDDNHDFIWEADEYPED